SQLGNEHRREELKNLIYRRDVDGFKSLFNTITNEEGHDVIQWYLYGVDDEGRDLLGWASRRVNNCKLIHFLIENGAKLNHQDSEGYTPYMKAAECGCCENIECLFKNNNNINIAMTKNKYGATLL